MGNNVQNEVFSLEQNLSIPECTGLDNHMILRLIRKEVKAFIEIFKQLSETLKNEYHDNFAFLYENLWMNEIVSLSVIPGLEEQRLIALTDMVKTRIFRIGRAIDTSYFVNHLLTERSFIQAIKTCYTADDSLKCSFWEWIFILDKYSVRKEQANQLFECYRKTRRYYLLYLYRSNNNAYYLTKSKDMIEQEKIIIDIVQNSNREFYEIAAELSSFIKNAPDAKAAEILKPRNFRYTDTNNKHGIDKNKFYECVNKKNSESYNEAICILLRCELPFELQKDYIYIQDRLKVLYEMIEKYNAVYVVDLHTLFETYLPECLRLSLSFFEYLEFDPAGKEVKNIQESLYKAIKKLRQAIDQEISSVIKFTSLDDIAKVKALETLMIRDGYVDDQYLIRKRM